MALATNQFTITNMTEGVSISLSQDSIVIQVEYDGSGGVFGTSATSTTASVFVGGADDSANWTFTPTVSGVTGTASNNGRTFTITSMPSSGDSGLITFSASKTGFSTLTKTCTIAKVKNGAIESIPMYRTPVSPDHGLFYNSTHFGFYDNGDWRTYMDEKGNFALGDPVNDKGIVWNNESNPKTLAVSGQIIMRSGSSLDRTTSYYSGSKPTIICARKSPSDTTTAIVTAKRLQTLGYTVTWTTFNETVSQCDPYDIILVDHYVWGADADNAFIKSAFDAGKKILVTGNDSTSALFYITSHSASSMLLGARVKAQNSHPTYTGWSTLPDDPDAGRAITGLIPEAKILTKHSNGGSIADVLVLRSNIGGILVHAQSPLGRNPTADSDKFLTNLIEYMAGNLLADTSEIGFINGVSASTVQDGSNRATTGLTTDGYISKIIKGSTLSTTGMVAGLNITKDYLGYYDGTTWKSYIDKNGYFKFGDGDTGPGISWDPTANGGSGVLAIRGNLVASDIKSGGTLSGQNIVGGTITIGSLDSVFKADANGIYLGDATFANAPFRVGMDGILRTRGAVLTGAINPIYTFSVLGTGGGQAVAYPYCYLRKTGATTAWDTNVITNESTAGECYVSWKPNQTDCNLMSGLTYDDGSAAVSYPTIDFCWYMKSTGVLDIYESGSPKTGGPYGGTYTTSTVLSITYDNYYIRYYKDGVQIASTTIGQSKSFIGTTAFYTTAGRINYYKFGSGKMNGTYIDSTGIYTGTVTADQIITGTLNASQNITVGGVIIDAGSSTNTGNIRLAKTAFSDNTHSGFWLGNDAGTAKFNFGNATNKITWDGTTLGISGILAGSTLASKGSYLTAAAALGATTLYVADTSSFPASGTVYVFAPAGRTVATYTSKTATTLTIAAGGIGACAVGSLVLVNIDTTKNIVIDGLSNSVFMNNGSNNQFNVSLDPATNTDMLGIWAYGGQVGISVNSSTNVGIISSSDSSYAISLSGNTTCSPIKLAPQSTLPTNKVAGGIVYYSGTGAGGAGLYISNGTYWNKVTTSGNY